MFDEIYLELINKLKNNFEFIISITNDDKISEKCKSSLELIDKLNDSVNEELNNMEKLYSDKIWYIIDSSTRARIDEINYYSLEDAEIALNEKYGGLNYEIEVREK